MQIKMYFFVKNIVLLFLFTPNDPENGKNEDYYASCTARKMPVPS